MISSGKVPKKDRIRASMEKLSGREPEKSGIMSVQKNDIIRASIGKCRIRTSKEKLSGRVLEMRGISVSTEK